MGERDIERQRRRPTSRKRGSQSDIESKGKRREERRGVERDGETEEVTIVDRGWGMIRKRTGGVVMA